jgi:arylsulfatase A-like enzyme
MTGPPRVIAPALWNTAVSTPVELTDMFPTLAEITGVDVSTMGLDGISFTPLISSTSAHRAAVRGVAVFQFYAFLGRQVMSYGMRANRWRYVVHVNGPVTTGPIIKDELYDMWNDPNETVSLAALQVKPPYVRVVLGQMRGIFKRHRSTHWRGVWNEGMDL